MKRLPLAILAAALLSSCAHEYDLALSLGYKDISASVSSRRAQAPVQPTK